MNKLLTLVVMCYALSAHASLPEVAQAQVDATAAQERVKALKKSLTKVEKAELAVIEAQRKLDKLKGK